MTYPQMSGLGQISLVTSAIDVCNTHDRIIFPVSLFPAVCLMLMRPFYRQSQ